jgi:hypothetical protein
MISINWSDDPDDIDAMIELFDYSEPEHADDCQCSECDPDPDLRFELDRENRSAA